MNENNFPYLRNHQYETKGTFKSKDHILKPATNDDSQGFMIIKARPFQLNNPNYGDCQFLRMLSSMPLHQAPYSMTKQKWLYRERLEAQAILPYLYLGPTPVAQDREWVANHGITMVIAVRSAQIASKFPKYMNPSTFPSCQQSNIETATFDIDGPHDIVAKVKPMLKQMNDHLAQRQQKTIPTSLDDIQGKILIFCESGNERSPVLAAAYLMLIWRLSWSDSLNYCHAFRFSIGLTTQMNSNLITLEGLLEAEHDVAAVLQETTNANATNNTRATKRGSKRTLDDAYDSDDTMTDDIEVETRAGIAPFIDK